MNFGKLIGIVGLIGLLYLLWMVRQVLLLVFAAISFATVINKLVQQLMKLSMPRGWAIAISLSGLVGISVGAA